MVELDTERFECYLIRREERRLVKYLKEEGHEEVNCGYIDLRDLELKCLEPIITVGSFAEGVAINYARSKGLPYVMLTQGHCLPNSSFTVYIAQFYTSKFSELESIEKSGRLSD